MPRLSLLSAAAVGLLLLAASNAPVVWGGEASGDVAKRALAECEAGRQARSREERLAHFQQGERLGQQAVAEHENSADAHFALFCNMGELMRLDGESITSVLSLRRLMSELDRTLALNPDHAPALAAKGTLLVRLPRLLGGDVHQGEAMLRKALVYDPTAVSARLALARTCGARGDRDEAIGFATRALQIARQLGRADKVAEAQATLADLHASQ